MRRAIRTGLAALAACATCAGAHAQEPAPDRIHPDAWASVRDHAPFVGVERSSAFRWSDAPRGGRLGAVAGLAPRDAPLGFDAQAAFGFRAFHLTVYADPDPGRFARGAGPHKAALRHAGLKVVDPEEPDAAALCATLMLCLMEIDAWSRGVAAERGIVTPVVVVLDVRPAPGPEPRLFAAADRVLNGAPPAAPSWERLLLEIDTALPERDPARLILVATGAAGSPPAAESMSEPRLLVDGVDARVLHDNAAPEAVRAAAWTGVLTVVLGAAWEGEEDLARLGPLEAARNGAHVVIVTPDTARRPLQLPGVGD